MWPRLPLVVAVILFVGGCAQLEVDRSVRYFKIQTTPRYIRASNYERALLLYGAGFLSEARKQALKVEKEESDYQATRELLKRIDLLTFWLSSEHIVMGQLYEKAGLFNAAIDEFTVALRLNPENRKIQARLDALKAGDLTYLVEEKAARQKAREQARSKQAERAEEPDGKGDKARQKIRKVQRKPTSEMLAFDHYRKGMVYLEADELALAIEEFEAVTKILPAYRAAGSFLEAARKRRDYEVDRHIKEGIASFQEEEMEKAIESWDAALKLDPGNETALDYRSRAEKVMSRLREIREGSE